MTSHSFDNLRAADEQTCLWAAEQFIATERNDICALFDRFTDYRLAGNSNVAEIDEGARAGIFIDQESGFVREIGEFAKARCLCETHDAVVRRMHAHDQARLLGN